MAIPGNLLSAATEAVDPNTSGWRPRLNATIGLGTGGRRGDGCLSVRSVAAGEAQAETVSTYPVIPGEMYQTFADAAGGGQPERIGIEWLDAVGVQVDLTWSLTTVAAASSWHRVGVAGVCPVGASKARLVTSDTPAAGAVSHFWENFYLGYPKRTTGNLLPFTVESGGELDTAGWTVETNGAVGRLVPVVSWPYNWYLSGAHVVTLTATAGGNTAMACTDRPGAQAGVEYLAYAYMAPPTVGAAAWIELRFYDAADNQLAASRGPLAAAGTGLVRQRVSGTAPAGTATAQMALGIDGAAGGQALWVEGAVIVAAPAIREGSVVPYADASFEQGVAGWGVVSGPGTIARSAPWGDLSVHDAYSLVVTSATTGTTVVRSAVFPLGAGGLDWRMQVTAQVMDGSWTAARRVVWLDDSDVVVETSDSGQIDVPGPGWWRLTSSWPQPAGATRARIELELVATAVGSVVALDRVLLWRDLPLTEVTPREDTASVTVVLRELDVDETVTLWRVTPDGIRTLVRGPDGLMEGVALGSELLVVEDYEAPLGVPVYYRMEALQADGTPGSYRSTAPVTVPAGDRQWAWLKDPAYPHRSTRVLVERAPDWQRPIQQTEYRVRGRRNAVVHSDVRGGLEGTLTVWTTSDEHRARLHWLLDSGHVLLVQAAPGMGVEDVYAAVGEVTESRVTTYAPEPWRTWSLPLMQVDMPAAVGVAGTAGRSWQDVLTTHDTWQQVLDRYATWEDVLFDRPIGGG